MAGGLRVARPGALPAGRSGAAAPDARADEAPSDRRGGRPHVVADAAGALAGLVAGDDLVHIEVDPARRPVLVMAGHPRVAEQLGDPEGGEPGLVGERLQPCPGLVPGDELIDVGAVHGPAGRRAGRHRGWGSGPWAVPAARTLVRR